MSVNTLLAAPGPTLVNLLSRAGVDVGDINHSDKFVAKFAPVQWYHWAFFECDLFNLGDYSEDLAAYLFKFGTFRTSFAAYFNF